MSDDLGGGLLFDEGSYPEAAGRMSLASDELGAGLGDSADLQGQAGEAMAGWAPTVEAGAELDRFHSLLDGALKQATEITGRDPGQLLETRARMDATERGIVSDIGDIRTDVTVPGSEPDGAAASSRIANALAGPGHDAPSLNQPGGRSRINIADLDLEALSPHDAEFIRYAARTYGDRLVIYDWNPGVQFNLLELSNVRANVHERVAQFLDEGGGNAGLYFGSGDISGLDDLGYLADTRPRGYPEGAKWKRVSGIYSPSNRVLAVGSGSSGSLSTPLHEFGHLVGRVYSSGGYDSAAWRAVYDKAVSAAERPISPYYLQPGEAGPDEMFAEAFVIYHRPVPDIPGWPSRDNQLSDLAGSDAGGQAFKRYFDTLLGLS